MNKFEQVSSDDHQMSLVEVSGLMSGGQDRSWRGPRSDVHGRLARENGASVQ